MTVKKTGVKTTASPFSFPSQKKQIVASFRSRALVTGTEARLLSCGIDTVLRCFTLLFLLFPSFFLIEFYRKGIHVEEEMRFGIFWAFFFFELVLQNFVLLFCTIRLYRKEYPCFPDELELSRYFFRRMIYFVLPVFVLSWETGLGWLVLYFILSLLLGGWIHYGCDKVAERYARFSEEARRRECAAENVDNEDPLGLDVGELSNEEELDTLPEGVIHQQTRSLLEQGERIEGRIRTLFLSQEERKVLFIGFCPPFTAVPQFYIESVNELDVQICVTRILPFGARIELKRRSLLAEESEGDFRYVADLLRAE